MRVGWSCAGRMRAGVEPQGPRTRRSAGWVSLRSSRRRPALALLAYLAILARPVSAAEVTSALWPLEVGRDSLGEAARGTLASLLTKARKIVGDEAVVSVGGTYQLAPGLVSCD